MRQANMDPHEGYSKYRAFKVELKPTPEQIEKIEQTMGVCRFVFNLFISENQRRRNEAIAQTQEGEKLKPTFMGGYEFSKWFNNEWRAANPDKSWVRNVSSKAVKHSIMNADTAYRRFLSGKAGFPKYKRRYGKPVGVYLPRNGKDLVVQRHRAKIPTIGWMRFKEFGYAPYDTIPVSVTISREADRYFASFLFKAISKAQMVSAVKNDGLGVDMGINVQAAVSDGRMYENINKTPRVKKLKKRLKHEQRKLSRKLENNKKKQKKEVESATKSNCTHMGTGSNVAKQRRKLQKAHRRLTCVRRDYLNKIAAELVSGNPAFITIEDLNVKGMMKNHHLARSIAECKFYYFRMVLTQKCHDYGIELRVVDRWYPSSKTCSVCRAVKHDLKLSDRAYECPVCGAVYDRDYNAAVNLRKCNKFAVA